MNDAAYVASGDADELSLDNCVTSTYDENTMQNTQSNSSKDVQKGQLQRTKPGKAKQEELEQYETVENASKELSDGTYTGTAPASHRRL